MRPHRFAEDIRNEAAEVPGPLGDPGRTNHRSQASQEQRSDAAAPKPQDTQETTREPGCRRTANHRSLAGDHSQQRAPPESGSHQTGTPDDERGRSSNTADVRITSGSQQRQDEGSRPDQPGEHRTVEDLEADDAKAEHRTVRESHAHVIHDRNPREPRPRGSTIDNDETTARSRTAGSQQRDRANRLKPRPYSTTATRSKTGRSRKNASRRRAGRPPPEVEDAGVDKTGKTETRFGSRNVISPRRTGHQHGAPSDRKAREPRPSGRHEHHRNGDPAGVPQHQAW